MTPNRKFRSHQLKLENFFLSRIIGKQLLNCNKSLAEPRENPRKPDSPVEKLVSLIKEAARS